MGIQWASSVLMPSHMGVFHAHGRGTFCHANWALVKLSALSDQYWERQQGPAQRAGCLSLT